MAKRQGEPYPWPMNFSSLSSYQRETKKPFFNKMLGGLSGLAIVADGFSTPGDTYTRSLEK